MEQQTAGKRPMALPITLLLLVVSLIGNVFLYSQFLQNGQEKKYELGKSIYGDAVSAIDYAEGISAQLPALTASGSLDERMAVKYEAAQSVAKQGAIVSLAKAAHTLTGEKGAIRTASFDGFIEYVDEQLQAVGRYEGELNEADRQSLLELGQVLDAISEHLRGTFNESIADSKAALIRVSTGIGWIDSMPELQQLAEQMPDK